ncbi:MAG: oligosaccharyl transferase, archaeosortase A system-associated, partial [Methanospirillum sp.]|uniref:oligosaccharyl transferase, archaeosortase A system-associated n=1 Tax=Methanospirillum sp. TaxID=45200 RepID=UPI0023701A03
FLVAIIGFFLIGVHGTEGLNYYTLGHPLAYGLIILTTLILFVISRYLHDHSLFQYILALIGVSVIALALFALSCPDMFQYLVSNANAFFGQSIHWKTIREAKPWTFEDAWHTFQYGLILFAIGVAILLNRIRKGISPSDLFVLIWSVVVLYATMQHIRYEYYLAVPLAILGGTALSSAIQYVRLPRCFHTLWSADIRKTEVTRKRHDHTHQHTGLRSLFSCGGLYFCFLLLLGVLFTYNSLGVDLAFGPLHLNPDWRESMEWMDLNTPDPGVDYLKIYQEEQWQPPTESYGVMSWWDYGHMITYIAKRMPNANPFQKGVDGDYGAARFFITTNESESSGILDNRKTRYIITDYLMDVSIFWAMATWNNPDVGLSPYQRNFIIPNKNNPNSGQNYSFFMEPYYRTMVSRLHNFDGSLKNPDRVFYINYLKPPYSGTTDPVIVNGSELSYTEASALIKNSTLDTDPRYGAALVNYVYTSPVSPVPALQHYRLVHESPTRASPQELPDIRYVKIFEYVPGAVITGDGIIEITVRTNTGREFVYRQESVNGSFTVPYPTQSRIGDVETLGLYRIVETGDEFQVTDEQIINGETVPNIF